MQASFCASKALQPTACLNVRSAPPRLRLRRALVRAKHHVSLWHFSVERAQARAGQLPEVNRTYRGPSYMVSS